MVLKLLAMWMFYVLILDGSSAGGVMSAIRLLSAVRSSMPECIIWSRSRLLMTVTCPFLKLLLRFRVWKRRCTAQVLRSVRAGRLRRLLLVPMMYVCI